jgi:type I restriction enzyme S subunit
VNAVTVEDAFEFVRNGKSVKQDKSSGGLPITRIETIADGTIDGARVGYADLDEFGNEKWLLKPGDILFSHINSIEHIGKCALYTGNPEKLIHGMNLLALRPKAKILDPSYAHRVLSGPAFRSSLQQFVNKAVNQASISTTNLKTLEIPLPPLPEQRRIAAILDRADTLRRKRKRAIELLDSLTQSIFLEMFGDPVTNDRRFPVCQIAELGTIRTGKTPPSSNRALFDGDVPFATPSDLDSGLHTTARSISEEGIKYASFTPAGSALVCCIGTIGKVAKTPVGTAFNQQINAVQWSDPEGNDFGAVLLPFYKKEMLNKASATTVPILNKSAFSSIEVIDPPSELKRTFSLKVKTIETRRQVMQQSEQKTGFFFSSLQHRAFSGEL